MHNCSVQVFIAFIRISARKIKHSKIGNCANKVCITNQTTHVLMIYLNRKKINRVTILQKNLNLGHSKIFHKI